MGKTALNPITKKKLKNMHVVRLQGICRLGRNGIKTLRVFVISIVMVWGVLQTPPVHAGFGHILKGVKKAIGISGELSEGQIIERLKEALKKIKDKKSLLDIIYKKSLFGGASIRKISLVCQEKRDHNIWRFWIVRLCEGLWTIREQEGKLASMIKIKSCINKR